MEMLFTKEETNKNHLFNLRPMEIPQNTGINSITDIRGVHTLADALNLDAENVKS